MMLLLSHVSSVSIDTIHNFLQDNKEEIGKFLANNADTINNLAK